MTWPASTVLHGYALQGLPPEPVTITPSQGGLVCIQQGDRLPMFVPGLALLAAVTDACRHLGLLSTATTPTPGGPR